MANNTYVLLAKSTVGAAGAASIDFTNIPQTGYTDLLLKTSLRAVSDVIDFYIQFNGATTNHSDKWLYGTGAAANSISNSNINAIGDRSSYTANVFSNGETYIPNYTSSNYKSVSSDIVTENNATTALSLLQSGLWSNTAAITSLKIIPSSGNIAANSTAYLYGISNVNTTPTVAPFATGGDIITNDGTYWYHAFLSTGTFTPAKTLSCNMLVVAGGGSGGSDSSGGGGAGGLQAFTSQSLSATGYTVTIGAGGAGNSTKASNGNSGNNSQFGALTASVGGGYGSGGAGGSGGSGGGGRTGGGTATSGQGNNGGSGVNSGSFPAGGGGGAGGAGSAGSGSTGGAGGAGTNTYSAWATATSTGVSGYYAGGGGGGVASGTGGAAGSGGATAGVVSPNFSGNATANTGSGSGGAGDPSGTTGNGGSGIVIVRYAMA